MVKKIGKNKISKSADKKTKAEDLLVRLKAKEFEIELQRLELSQKQEELEASLARYEDLYDFAPTGYLTLDEKGRIKEINHTGAEMLGSKKNNLINIPFIYCLSPDETQKFLTILRKIKNLNTYISEDFEIKLKNKEPVYIHIVFSSVHNYRSKELNFRISLTDITDKKVIENALKESEVRFRTMAESAPVMIWMSDENNNLVYANKTKLQFLGKDFDSIKGSKWLNHIHPDDRKKYLNICNEALNERKYFSVEMRVKNRDNEYRWVIRNGAPNLMADGKTYGLIGSEIDITTRITSEMLTQKSLKEKEVLLKEIHHRVKNNLQIISSLLNLQVNYINNEEISGILKASQSRIRSMALIHEKLYKSSELSMINFSEYVKELVSFLFKTYRNKSGNLKLEMMLTDVNLDINLSISLGLILNELITNSLKHAFPDKRAGLLKISLSEKNNQLELVVADNGVGLPEDFNIKKANSLGLELVDTLINQHHGELEINRNGITEFKIHLHKNSSPPIPTS